MKKVALHITNLFLCLLVTLSGTGLHFYTSKCLHSEHVALSLRAESEPCCTGCCSHDLRADEGTSAAFGSNCCADVVLQLSVDSFAENKPCSLSASVLLAIVPQQNRLPVGLLSDINAALAGSDILRYRSASEMLHCYGQLRL